MRALCSTHLIGEAIVICLGALVAMSLTDISTGLLWAVAGPAALLCILLCGKLSAPWAVPAGWALQFALIAAGFVVPMMFVVGVVFAGIWYACVRVGRTIDAAKAARA
ncbi:DUF4233 domain-containing protein [Yinghuangia soli]|uniref:DUF4233 domain-containing protein n=1 Tax=Yinghuangia soli TaxID=2908204 RepID=A0AA41Q8E4_9ACTN|nr:DUF4233 domain-containing protein [Yinghuangia soli]MCF2533509.1 DUF4233 domain-containing protein [Yinghuangia soli]